jgi:RNA polymerase subunit RPABC4/transcription elongation factor Spt4
VIKIDNPACASCGNPMSLDAAICPTCGSTLGARNWIMTTAPGSGRIL